MHSRSSDGLVNIGQCDVDGKKGMRSVIFCDFSETSCFSHFLFQQRVLEIDAMGSVFDDEC